VADDVIPGTSGAPVRTDDADWATIVSLCGLNEQDLELLGAHQDFARDLAQRAPEAFYAEILGDPELRALIERHSSVDALSQTMQDYVASLFSGRYDDDTVHARVTIGRVHDRVDLPLGAYLSAYRKIHELVVHAIVRAHRRNETKLFQTLVAYLRVAQTDAAIVAQSFVSSRDGQLTATASGGHGVQKATRGVGDAREALDEIRRQVAELSAQMREIDGLAGTIGAIADQTSLLAGQIERISAGIAEISAAAPPSPAGRSVADAVDALQRLAVGEDAA
jgi:heam-based aerotactic trancducer